MTLEKDLTRSFALFFAVMLLFLFALVFLVLKIEKQRAVSPCDIPGHCCVAVRALVPVSDGKAVVPMVIISHREVPCGVK